MYVANTHLKPVIGIDIHFVNMPVPFIPLPHPYIGLVIDPFDYIPFIGATVKVNHVPRGNTDTTGMIITFIHIPFGAGFTLTPMIGHDSQNFFGSKTVSVDGAPMSGAGYILMTCNDIGLPLSFSPGKKIKPIPSLYLPTSFCIPLQWGKPVLVGGPLVPNFSLMALLKAFAFGSFLKIFGKLGGKLLKALNNKLLKKIPGTKKLTNKLCKMGFEPVDLVTGRVNYEYTDFELPGPIPIKWTRNWDSDSSIKGLLGHGVQLSYDRCIRALPEEGCLAVTLADGRHVAFPLLQPGDSFYHPQEKMVLRRKQNGHFILEEYNNSLYYHFNHDTEPGIWRLSFIENYSGNRIQLHYTGGSLTAITDSAGRQLLLRLDKQHRIVEVQVKHRTRQQTLVSYAYNEEGDLISIADALEQAVTIEYDDHKMVKKTDRNGQSFYWEYDSKRRCVHTWGDGGILEGFIEYGKGYNTVTNSLGEVTTYYFEENNLCVQETDHYGNHRYTEYTEDFNVYREIDEAGNITGYAYDEQNRLKEKTLPDGATTQYHYNEHNQLTLLVHPNGISQTYGYDQQRRLCYINYPNGKTISYEYNANGQREAVIETGGARSLLSYDEDENLTGIHSADGFSISWKYDALGRCIQSTNSNGEVRFFEYDALRRVRSLHLPDGNTVRLEYDAYAQVTCATDRHKQVQFEYTPLGRLKLKKLPGAELHFLYDTEDRLNAIINEKGKRYLVDYNKRGEVIKETGFNGIIRELERDATGNIIRTGVPGGRSTEYEYDSNDRVTRVVYDDGTWEMYSYDKSGNLQEAINQHSRTTFTRNKLGDILTEDQDGYQVYSEYNKAGARIHIGSSLGADIQLQRNKNGWVTGLQAGVNDLLWRSQMKYNQAGQEVERLLPGGLTSEWSYDHTGKPAEHKLSRNGVVQHWKKYTWNVNDRLTNIFDALSQHNTDYKHDALGNLVFAQYADNSIVHRAKDETGNVYETATQADRTYDGAGALLESKKYKYKYDGEGRLISKTNKASQQKTKYEWYGSGLLKRVVRHDGKIIAFKYDTLGRRIEKSCAGKITRWVWDGNVPLHEWSYDETDKPRAVVNEWGEITWDKPEPNLQNAPEHTNGITWVFDGDKPIPVAKIEKEATYTIVSDHLGTPHTMYNEDGKKVWEGVLDIYGRIRTLQSNKSAVPFRFQGQYEDAETGLVYNRFRYYDPEAGTYISSDPIGILGGYNEYSYVSNPATHVDVYGLSPIDPFADLAQLRSELGMPPLSDTRSADGVLARLDVDGKSYYGINRWVAPDSASKQAYIDAGLDPPYPAVTNHAEGDAILQAWKDGGKRNGGTGHLYVDSDCCGFCRTNLNSLRKKLGLDDLIVHQRGYPPMSTKAKGFAKKESHVKIQCQ
jgi:RHS repeat-associated protein